MNEFEYKVRYLSEDEYLLSSEQFIVKTEGDEEQARDEVHSYAEQHAEDIGAADYEITLIDAH